MKKTKKPLIRLIENVKANDPGVFRMCALYTLVTLCVPLFSVLLPRVLIGYLTESTPTLNGILVIVCAFFAVGAVFHFLKQWLHDSTYTRLTALRIDYVRDMAVKLLRMDYKYMESARFFDERTSAFEATSSNNNGVEGIYHRLFDLPQLILIVLLLSVFIGLLSLPVLIALVVHTAATTFAAVAVQKYQYARKEELSKAERRVFYYSRAAKDFSYGKDVRMYDVKARILDNFKVQIKGYADVFRAIRNREYALGFITLATLLIADLAIYGILTWLTVNGMSIANYSMYIVAASTLSVQMKALSDNVTYIMQEYMYVRDFFDYLDENLGEAGGSLPAVPAGTPLEIEFENVTFRYPDTDKNIFENFSLKIPAGQKLALVGINGAGKTTFVKLLTGLFKADSGRILINGKDVNEYQKSALFKMFAAVFQDVNILAFTVAQNVACALDGIDYARVEDVLQQVGLYEKVQSLENGMDTMMLRIIDENGAVFSGGESQKLAIARALYKGGNCVIMDEPTAALDALAEAEIYAEFDELTKGRTAIYISHRLASTRFCDKIALIDGTGLVEYGSHDELMQKGGVYRDMFVTQGKYYQESGVAV
ncbi:MAG: ABC transporter ATP-binding protein [Christensenellales bacterium]|jgi:ABC-type multidrug transport system fused ATPase/permease subunit